MAKIAVLGSGRFVEIVRAFVRKTYGEGALVENEQAEVGIVDLDAYGAHKQLADWRQRHPEQPVIALSLRDPEDKGVIWVKKPFTAEDLAQILQRVCAPKTKLVIQKEESGSVHSAAIGVAKKDKNEILHVRHNWAEDSNSHYNPADYLQGQLTKAYRQATLTGIVVRLETGWEPILVFPKLKKVWTNGNDKKLHAFCRVPLKTFARLNGNSVEVAIKPEPEAAFIEPPRPLQPMDAFLWKVAWWSSGGRLPFGFAPDRPLRLTRWPNLTRYLCPPYAVRLCALFHQKALAPYKAAELLGLTPGEVFAFLSAAGALGLVEQVTASTLSRAEPPPPAKNLGFLRRILQRLVKG
ncbi:MAG: hypothetical protein ACK4JF_09550 [Methylohalobius sp.]